MPFFIAINTKFISFGDLALFAPHGGKCCFVSRIRPFWLIVFLLNLVFESISPGVPIVRGCVFVDGFSCLNTIQREKDLFQYCDWDRLVIKLCPCFKAFSFAPVSRIGIFLHL